MNPTLYALLIILFVAHTSLTIWLEIRMRKSQKIWTDYAMELNEEIADSYAELKEFEQKYNDLLAKYNTLTDRDSKGRFKK